jgi:heme-degrading monooxygenase HmoA
MISRHWIGIVNADHVSEYLEHLDNKVFPNLQKSEGLKNCYYLKRKVNEGMEFLIVTEWESVESIINFAGTDYEKSVVDDYAKSLMVSYEARVKHYTI